jgi:hypothetical protein
MEADDADTDAGPRAALMNAADAAPMPMLATRRIDGSRRCRYRCWPTCRIDGRRRWRTDADAGHAPH